MPVPWRRLPCACAWGDVRGRGIRRTRTAPPAGGRPTARSPAAARPRGSPIGAPAGWSCLRARAAAAWCRPDAGAAPAGCGCARSAQANASVTPGSSSTTRIVCTESTLLGGLRPPHALQASSGPECLSRYDARRHPSPDNRGLRGLRAAQAERFQGCRTSPPRRDARAQGTIALTEVQGYKYRPNCKPAELAQVPDQAEHASALRQQALRLCERFASRPSGRRNSARTRSLDGRKQPHSVCSSNARQVLWSGIASPRRMTP
ncbi:hypothetical protein D9M68_422310 [compost metagenome]